ncbi:MAG: biotin/lipoyl-binding protein, partial [Paramuribaculum sp.]
KYKINGNTYKVAVGDIENNIAQVEVNGTPYRVELDEQKAPVKIVSKPRPSAAPRTESGAKVIAKPAAAAAGAYQVKAPLPGTVVSIAVKVGDTVAASDTVAVLEAMKMENAIRAGRDGKVASINVSAGDAVLEGTAIVTLE